MIDLVSILLGATLIYIALEDFKHLAVRWLAFPVLFFLAFGYGNLNSSSFSEGLILTLLNLCIVGVQFLGLSCYNYFKYGAINVLNQKIGLGDFMFLIAISPIFHPTYFVIFLVSSLILILLFLLLRKKENEHIPLAGYLSLFLIGWILVAKVFDINMHSTPIVARLI